MPSPLVVRYSGAVLLFIVGAVVLGISVHVEHSTRVLGFKSHTFTYDAFVGAWTILAEIVLAVTRHFFSQTVLATFLVEISVLCLSMIFWLAAGIDTTLFTSEDRSVCKHIDDLFDLPEFENADPQVIQAAKKIFQSACSELHAQLAFIWIGFIVTTLLLGYLVVHALRMKHHGVPNVFQKTLKLSNYIENAPRDPFADPSGNYGVVGAGIAQDEARSPRR
ncbi:hypothetical protein BD324DRAFT_168878 [Kockovaella imperatae]|uniref:MARVEL domain-containing protein n=1 Tax=Kockovaella imperatae TaxID=4999 RepID=A0A1Y1U9K4_9TREE|nr:hypothetical protein BD324DRAFT_168878 [Kockovaella imperatae]ORX34186.1 hypothetical protein BD324DRAFT_168878 [Kockovaella imperatae]